MTEAIRVGDRVDHYRYGRGVVERLVSQGLAEVRFGPALEYVELKNLLSLDRLEREAREYEERKLVEAERKKHSVREAQMCALKNQVLTYIKRADYESAQSLYQAQCREWWPNNEYIAHISRAKEEQVAKAVEEAAHQLAATRKNIRSQVVKLLFEANYDEADRLYKNSCVEWWSQVDYQTEVARARFMHHFIGVYSEGSLAELDAVYRERPPQVNLSTDDFVSLKLPRVQSCLAEIGIRLDEEQERASARPEHRLLIKARAGSGKTRTLCARAALAIYDERLAPNQVMVLAFNKAAAAEVKQRIQEAGIPDFDNARTFHSLAYKLANPKKKLLFDAGGHPSVREQTRFAQRVMQRILNPAFKEAMVEFFRKELEQIEDIGRDLAPDEYLQFRRTLELMSLRGERVKSNGEKFIADFLFEHGIKYSYERAWIWSSDFLEGAVYKPDFSIVADGNDYILEHWAIDPNDPYAALPTHWNISTEQYRQQIVAKREFWHSKNKQLLETHTGLLKNGREAFENQLKSILLNVGISNQRLSKVEIVSRVFENDFAISRMSALFLQFIQRAKKRGWSAHSTSQRIEDMSDKEPRVQLFQQLALRAYREYESVLEEQSAMDFDDLLVQATEEVNARGGAANIHIGEGRMQPLSELKWILVDEYQDFSELYFRMLDAILKANPAIRLVAVGDDWQSINAYAGADLRFFDQFPEYFPDAEMVGITTNYRSDWAVVAAGNQLMKGRGIPAKVRKATSGFIEIKHLSDAWIEFRNGEQFQQGRESDSLYLPPQINGKNPSESALRQAQVLKLCTQIFLEKPDQKTLLLARTGIAYGLELAEFKQRLIKILSTLLKIKHDRLEKNIDVITSHGSKGQEAYRVIILDATERQFPKVHPDNLLFELFGVTPHTVLEEERRLFYVSMTRAEHCIYVLTEKGKMSPYLEEISNQPMTYGVKNESFSINRTPLGDLAKKIRAGIDALSVSTNTPR